MRKVLITDSMNPKCIDILNSDKFEVDYKPGLKAEEIEKIIPEYNILVVRSATTVTKDIIAKGNKLELIGRAGTGVDNIDLDAATRKGVIVMNTPGGNTISAAEHALALLMSLCRHVPQADKSMKEGRWDRKLYSGVELFGKKIGIIGLGKIGREVATRVKSFGMEVLGYDPILSKDVADEMGINMLPLQDIYKEADFITLHVPLTDETKNMISSKTLKMCKDNVRIVNCARGGLVDEEAAFEALESGKLAGIALDVYDKEPPENRKLINHPKAICTPHLGASTEEAQEKVAIQLAEQIIDLFNNKDFRGTVNSLAIKYASDERVKPYVELAEKIGLLHSQIDLGNLKGVKVNIGGSFLHKYSSVLVPAFLRGLISRLVSEPVNFVNAPFIASEMGIKVSELKVDTGKSDAPKLSVEVYYSDNREMRKIGGTVIANSDYRITHIDDFHFEIKPEGNMIFYYNNDRPGVLAKVSSVLAAAKINIAGLSLSRKNKGDQALTVISIDESVSEDVIEKIKEIEEINSVYNVRL